MHTEANLERQEWKLVFADTMTANWHTNWFLDGEKRRITHSDEGMDFWAGSQAGDDTFHAVLWTKQSFSGDIKIEYAFTRLDQAVRFVNIIYIQATGSGAPGYPAGRICKLNPQCACISTICTPTLSVLRLTV